MCFSVTALSLAAAALMLIRDISEKQVFCLVQPVGGASGISAALFFVVLLEAQSAVYSVCCWYSVVRFGHVWALYCWVVSPLISMFSRVRLMEQVETLQGENSSLPSLLLMWRLDRPLKKNPMNKRWETKCSFRFDYFKT